MNYYERLHAARNPYTPINLLETLATDKEHWVRYKAAMNPNATEIVKRLFLMTDAQS